MAYLTRNELLKTLSCARKENERDWLMVLVGFWHGLRASEVVSLHTDNIRDDYLIVQRGKNSRKTEQRLYDRPHEPLLDEAPALKKLAREANGYLFASDNGWHLHRSTFYRIFRRAAEAAGLRHPLTHPHILKHTVAMLTLQNAGEAGVGIVQKHLGHVSGRSTLEYLKVDAETASRVVGEAI